MFLFNHITAGSDIFCGNQTGNTRAADEVQWILGSSGADASLVEKLVAGRTEGGMICRGLT